MQKKVVRIKKDNWLNFLAKREDEDQALKEYCLGTKISSENSDAYDETASLDIEGDYLVVTFLSTL